MKVLVKVLVSVLVVLLERMMILLARRPHGSQQMSMLSRVHSHEAVALRLETPV